MKKFACYEEENIHYWTNRAPSYSVVNQEELESDQHSVWQSVLTEQIRAYFPSRRPESIRVLDVGTGPGFFAIILAEQGYRVSAVDYTPSMLAQAKYNAGPLKEKIDFREMNAEELTFADNSFDVVVSRNLTWNLPHPENAYAHWSRVLKPGGLLLNFDANWYSYLHDEDAKANHLADRENIKTAGVRDETAGTDVDAMEAIAYQTPLAASVRPGWDLRVLKGCGMKAKADTNIWKRVWTFEERTNNASTPMFMIESVKAV